MPRNTRVNKEADAREVLSSAIAEYKKLYSEPRSAAADTVLAALEAVKDTHPDTVRAFADMDKWCRSINVDPFIDTLIYAVTIRKEAGAWEGETKAVLGKMKKAREAIATLKANAPHLIIGGAELVAGFDAHFKEWNTAISITESIATATLQSTHLKPWRDGDFQLRAAIRYLVSVTYTKLSDPDIAKLATAIFGDPNDEETTISDERVRKARRELTEPKRKGRATSKKATRPGF